LESLYRITYPNYDVIVVDNGSKDDSVQKIKEYCEGKIKVESKFFEYDPSNKPIYVLEYTREEAEKGGDFREEKYFSKLPSDRKLRLILNEKNYGFAEGNNIGIRYALRALNPDYVLLLNNDTVVDPTFLTELVKVAESDKKIGIVGPKIYYYDFNGRTDIIWYSGGKINWWLGRPYHCKIKTCDSRVYEGHEEVEFITGCCMLINTKVGNIFFDKVYFLYFEDVDLCVRVKRKGFKLVHTPLSKIWHKISKSSETHSILYNYYFARNRIIFMRKFSKNYHKIVFYTIQLIIKNIISFIYFTLKYKNLKLWISFVKGLKDGLFYRTLYTSMSPLELL